MCQHCSAHAYKNVFQALLTVSFNSTNILGKMEKLNFVSCVAWVARGVAKETPNVFKATKEEVEEQMQEASQKVKEM